MIIGVVIVWIVMVALPKRYRVPSSTSTSSAPSLPAKLNLYAQQQMTARNTKRRVDLNGLMAQLENYHDNHGYYPSLAQLNDDDFWRANFPNFDRAGIGDPQANTSQFAAGIQNAEQRQYAYIVEPAGCNNQAVKCTSYRLEANMENGEPVYIKNSLSGIE